MIVSFSTTSYGNCHFGYKKISLKKKTELATAAEHGLCFFEGGEVGGISSNFDL
jgi:hypothetical protein